ncbi:MAG: MBL fold metallo-hydrolase, partial [Methanothrix sp.]
VDLGGLTLQVIHTPGHSPGSVSLWYAEEKALFSADAIPIPGDMPIYQDILASVRSIQRLKRIEGIEHLLSAWDGPRSGSNAYLVMDRGLEYLQRIHSAVLRAADGMGSPAEIDPMELCRRVVTEMGLPLHMTNPLVARSFMSSLTTRMTS